MGEPTYENYERAADIAERAIATSKAENEAECFDPDNFYYYGYSDMYDPNGGLGL